MRILCLILSIMTCVFLLACSDTPANEKIEAVATTEPFDPTETKATLMTQDGAIEISSKELCDIYTENAAKFYSKYSGRTATITGTVKKVEIAEQTDYSLGKTLDIYIISLEEGWRITVFQYSHPEVIDFSAGDKITVTSMIQNVWERNVTMQLASYVFRDGQIINVEDETIIEIVNE